MGRPSLPGQRWVLRSEGREQGPGFAGGGDVARELVGGGVEVDRCDRVPGGPTLPGVDRAGESGVVLSEELQLGGLPIVGVEPLQRIAVCDSGLMTLLAHGFEGSLELIEQARTPDGTLAASRLVSPFTVRMTRRYG